MVQMSLTETGQVFSWHQQASSTTFLTGRTAPHPAPDLHVLITREDRPPGTRRLRNSDMWRERKAKRDNELKVKEMSLFRNAVTFLHWSVLKVQRLMKQISFLKAKSRDVLS